DYAVSARSFRRRRDQIRPGGARNASDWGGFPSDVERSTVHPQASAAFLDSQYIDYPPRRLFHVGVCADVAPRIPVSTVAHVEDGWANGRIRLCDLTDDLGIGADCTHGRQLHRLHR